MNDLTIQFLNYLRIDRNYSLKTCDSYGRDIESYLSYIQENELNMFDMSTNSIRDYMTIVMMNGLSKRSLKRHLCAIRHFYNWLVDHDYARSNPFLTIRSPKADNRLPDYLYYEDVEKLFKTNNERTDFFAERDQAILELMYSSGLRAAEVCNLGLSDVDLKNRIMRIIGKGNKERVVPFSKIAQTTIMKYLKECRYVLLSRNKNMDLPDNLFLNNKGYPLTTRGLEYIFKQIEQKCSIDLNLHPHILRHTFATHLLDNNADLRVIQELMGHASLASTQVYTHVSREKMQVTYLDAHPRAKKKE